MVKKDCTGERLMKIETDIDYIKQEQQEQKKMLQDFINSADNKYASKVVEKGFYGLATIIVVAVIYAIMKGVTL